MSQTHTRDWGPKVQSQLIAKEQPAQMAAAFHEASPFAQLAAPPKAQPDTPGKLGSDSMLPVPQSSLNNQHRTQHMNADSNDSCAFPSPEPPQSSQTPTIVASEGIHQSVALKSTLNAAFPPSNSHLKNLDNHNNNAVSNSDGGRVTTSTSQHPCTLDQQSSPMATVASSLARRPYQNNGSSHRQNSHYSHPNWRTYTFVDVFVHGLPPHATTFDLYKNFIQHGEIAMITLKNSPGGTSKNHADIRFKPPPKEAFWETSWHHFKDSDGGISSVGVKLSSTQRQNFTVQSPVHNKIFYNEETELHAESISFGVLTNPGTMMIMKTRQSVPKSKVKLVVNLKRKEIDIRFPSIARVAPAHLYDQFPWFRPEHRFCISLDQDFSISQIHEPNNRISFVLRLDEPPPYSKKQHEQVLGSHVAEARRWLENDVWLRQTMIGSPQQEVHDATTPISLARSEGAINVGRWRAFRVTFDEAERDVDKFRIMTQALRDFNIKVVAADDFKYIPPVVPVWEFLDRHLRPQAAIPPSHARDLSLLDEHTSLTLPFLVRYLLDVCISSGRLNEYVVREDFLRALAAAGESKACNRLKLILDMPLNKQLADPMSIFDNRKHRPILRKEPKIPDNCALIYSATVTATSIVFYAPSLEITNRIIRQYKHHADRFLRVRFEDDKYRGNSRIYANTTNKMDAIFRRVRRTLTNGITIGDRKYEFLAWGNSQLREHGAYFFASVPNGLTASQIRAVMGQFDHEKIIAKRAARMGQCFSTTKPVRLRIPRVTRTSLIDDVCRNGYTFTDGVGQISPLLADLINHQLKVDDHTPSLFQFRLGGCKGVLAISEDLKGIDIRLRNSQFKFASESNDLEIIRCSRFEGAHLNRQLILVLSALGVDDPVFVKMQYKEMQDLEAAMEDDTIAQEKLKTTVDANGSTLELADMVECGFRAKNDPFVTSLLQLWRAWSLKYLREKAKLHVENGATLLGCVDETATLRGHYDHDQPQIDATYEERLAKLPEIFVQVETLNSKQQRAKQSREGEKADLPVYEVKQGICLIARNPSLHEGDIRVVKAIDVPALSHLRDVLVLPQTGDRDLSNMCSGGDLDGDDYLVIWAEDSQSRRPRFDLLPSVWNAEPMDYTAPEPVRAEGEVTPTHIIEFFDQYMRNDFIGKIAHAHLGWADSHDEGIKSEQCLELANLHSQAVDYPKTGRAARLPRALDRFEWPHFMEKKGGKEYRSHKILGKLYDKVQRVNFVPNYRGTFDDRIMNALEPSKAVRYEVEELKRDYDASLRRIMAQHEIKTEFEVWSTFVLDHSKASRDFKFHEEIGNLSKSLKEEFEEAIVAAAGGRTPEHLQPYAVAAYQLVQNEVSKALEAVEKGEREEAPAQMPLMSFPWILQGTLGKLAMTVTQQAKSRASFETHAENSEERQDAKDLFSKRQPIHINLQGELFADPYQAGTQSVNDKAEDINTTAVETTIHESFRSMDETGLRGQLAPAPSNVEHMHYPQSPLLSTGGPLPGTDSSSRATRRGTSLLDGDEGMNIGTDPKTFNGQILVPPQITNQQWEEIDAIIGSPLASHSGDYDTLVHVSKDSSAPVSHVGSMASSSDGVQSGHQLFSSEKRPALQGISSRSVSAELEGLEFGPQSYVDEEGTYRSKYRRSSAQSGSASSGRVSGEGHPAPVVIFPKVGGPGTSASGMPTLPERTDMERSRRPAEFKARSTATTLSAKAECRTEVDSDDEGEVLVYGDPAGIAQ